MLAGKSPSLRPLVAAAKRASNWLSDFLWGQDCAACGAEVGASDLFCQKCCERTKVVAPPWCPRCGFPYPTPPSRLCPQCEQGSSLFGTLRVRWLYYRASPAPDPVASAIRRFKYGDCRRIGPRLAGQLALLVDSSRYDLVMPVPLHPSRLRERGFNQAAVLAGAVAKQCGLRDDSLTLRRSRRTGSQVGRSYRERLLNVAGAFRVAWPERTQGARVLLVDDVVTSGATVRDCCRALVRAGAERVDVVALARTAR